MSLSVLSSRIAPNLRGTGGRRRRTMRESVRAAAASDEGEGEARFTAFELEGWNRLAKAYHERFGKLTSQSVEPLLDAVEATESIKLLDVATGPGYLAAAAATGRGANVVGLDFSGEERKRFAHQTHETRPSFVYRNQNEN